MWSSLLAFISHETKRHHFLKYVLLLGVLLAYFLFVAKKFGPTDGLFISILTWAFFVFCTPVADAGFLLDFPVRLLTGLRMVYSEIIVWLAALAVTLLALVLEPVLFQQTLLLQVYWHVLNNPFPNMLIILVSGLGTFLSIYFGDELFDVSLHRERVKYHRHLSKYQLIVFVFVILLLLVLYEFILLKIGVEIPL